MNRFVLNKFLKRLSIVYINKKRRVLSVTNTKIITHNGNERKSIQNIYTINLSKFHKLNFNFS